MSQLSLRQQTESQSSNAHTLSSLAQSNKNLACALTALLKELKSLFFYEESGTVLEQLRSIVHRYEQQTSDLTAAYSSGNKAANANLKNHSHAFSLRSFNELPPSQKSSLDRTILAVDQ